ncbi:MAG: hypothetical protein IJ016_04410 [Elusimicrobiaceae bacterium]|nr:hypothetical protein [Elusimicrobiaceae bacterium]
MVALWNAYFKYAKDPAAAVRGLVEERRFSGALVGYAAAALCWVVFFWIGDNLSVWGLLWRFAFFWLLEVTFGYLWAALSGLFLNFFSDSNGSSSLFVVLGLSGLVQGILLVFALFAAALPWLKPLAALAFVISIMWRFSFVVLNTARVSNVGLAKAFCVLCFAFVPVTAIALLSLGALILTVSLLV